MPTIYMRALQILRTYIGLVDGFLRVCMGLRRLFMSVGLCIRTAILGLYLGHAELYAWHGGWRFGLHA